MTVTSKKYPSKKGDITLFTITNDKGASVVLSTLGAGIVSVNVPDAKGNLADVVIGYADPADYFYDGPCAGKVPGRYANRIARGLFSIDGNEYHLAINNGPNALHGGPEGFQNQIWEGAAEGDNKVVFTYRAKDGEEGYPGNMTLRATYTWSDDCTLTLSFEAVADKKTVVNLTNHAYFNLAGHGSGQVLGHELKLNASKWLPTDDTLIPSGEIASVEGTPMDFTAAKTLGRDIKADFPALKYGKGYDNCWMLDGWKEGTVVKAAELTDPTTGRTLEVLTDQPAVQVYTGNWLEGCPAGKDGAVYHDYSAVAIECQGCPDAPNHANFPSQLLVPGETYRRTIAFRFSNK